MMLMRPDNFDHACSRARGIGRETLQDVAALAVEIVCEGREGRKIGTLFVVGDTPSVMRRSKVLDPLRGHPAHRKRLASRDMRETVKELAQLDGAFIVSADGVVLSACRYLDTSSHGIKLPLGLGGRHMAAASITRQTSAVTFVVSESSVVCMFDAGRLVAESPRRSG